MTSNPLASAILKINRAEKHISDVKREVEAFEGGRNYRTFADYDSQPGRTLIKLHFVSLPDKSIKCSAADAVQNLRCALDHLAWQVHLRHRPSVAEPIRMTKVSFTIFDDWDEYVGRKSQRLIAQIGGSMWTSFLDHVKPYRGGNDLLYALNLANNLDKHRDILELGTFPTGLRVTSPLGMPVSLDGFRRWPFEDEITIASHDGIVEGNPNVDTSFNIVLGDIEGLDNESVVDSLDKLLDAVKIVVEMWDGLVWHE